MLITMLTDCDAILARLWHLPGKWRDATRSTCRFRTGSKVSHGTCLALSGRATRPSRPAPATCRLRCFGQMRCAWGATSTTLFVSPALRQYLFRRSQLAKSACERLPYALEFWGRQTFCQTLGRDEQALHIFEARDFMLVEFWQMSSLSKPDERPTRGNVPPFRLPCMPMPLIRKRT